MDFASVIVFFVRRLKLHFAKQCETQQQTNCEAPFATNESLITHEHGVRHEVSTFFGIRADETNSVCNGLVKALFEHTYEDNYSRAVLT